MYLWPGIGIFLYLPLGAKETNLPIGFTTGLESKSGVPSISGPSFVIQYVECGLSQLTDNCYIQRIHFEKQMYYFPQYKILVNDFNHDRFTQDKYINLAALFHCKDLKMCSTLGFILLPHWIHNQFSKQLVLLGTGWLVYSQLLFEMFITNYRYPDQPQIILLYQP